MIVRDGEYGIYKVLDSDNVIVYINSDTREISTIENDLRTASNPLGDELRKHGDSWKVLWHAGPKLTSSQNIHKLKLGFIYRLNPRFN